MKKKSRTGLEIKLQIIEYFKEHKTERISKFLMKLNLSHPQVMQLVDEGFLVKEKISDQKVILSLYGVNK